MLKVLMLTMAMMLLGCAGNAPRIDYDRSVSFASLTRYAWVSHDEVKGYQSLDQTRIRRAFEAGLAAKGMTQVAVDQAQIWVDIDYAIDRRYEARSSLYGYSRWHPYWWGMEPEVYVQERDESKLSLLMIDPASKSVIWAGQMVLRYYQDKPPTERDASLKQQVDAILTQFPPR